MKVKIKSLEELKKLHSSIINTDSDDDILFEHRRLAVCFVEDMVDLCNTTLEVEQSLYNKDLYSSDMGWTFCYDWFKKPSRVKLSTTKGDKYT